MDPCWESIQQHSVIQALSNPSFLTAVDGEADQETLAYLQAHPQCAAEITHLRHIQNVLRARLYRLFCPSTDILIDYSLELLDYDQHIAIGDHLSLCPHCAAELVLLCVTAPELEEI